MLGNIILKKWFFGKLPNENWKGFLWHVVLFMHILIFVQEKIKCQLFSYDFYSYS
jgi:hypothetical protein